MCEPYSLRIYPMFATGYSVLFLSPTCKIKKRLMDISKEKRRGGGTQVQFLACFPLSISKSNDSCSPLFFLDILHEEPYTMSPTTDHEEPQKCFKLSVHLSWQAKSEAGISVILFHCFRMYSLNLEGCPKSSLPFLRMKKSRQKYSASLSFALTSPGLNDHFSSLLSFSRP